MEDYEKFARRHLSQLAKSEEGERRRPSPAPSLIRVHGRAILPPLLSGELREEMQRHRDAAQKAAGHRRLKDDPRMAHVQSILQSVQLRKTPTLEELLQESECLYSQKTSGGLVSEGDFFLETSEDSSSLSLPPSLRKGKDGLSFSPVTSKVLSSSFTSNVTPQQSYHEDCLVDRHDSQQGPQQSSPRGAIHQSPPSGDVTFENVENALSVSGLIDAGSESCGFGSSEGAHSMGDFFLHSTSNTITKMPEIICHPPTDGEEMERSGLELSLCNNFTAVKDICCISFQEDSVTCDHLTADKSDSSHLESTESGDTPHSAAALELDRDHILDRSEDPVSWSENSGSPESLELSETLSAHCNPTTQLHSHHEPTETEPADNGVDEVKPSEGPHRLSLQALLKKSQEYRRRQRMLRNQAKNSCVKERTQEPKPRPEEHSLSDKENDECPYKGSVTMEGKKSKERRGYLSPTVENSSLKKSLDNERMNENESIGKKTNVKSESNQLTGDMNTKEMIRVEEETTFKNNKLNSSQEVIIEPEQISVFIQQQPELTEASPIQEAFSMTIEQSDSCPTGIFQGVGKHYTIPVPNFCMSPVHSKSKGSIRDGETIDVAENSKGKVVDNTSLNEDHSVEEGSNRGDTAVPSYVNGMVQGDVTGVLAKSSECIDQLETNLSSLNVLISDLESTVKEHLENRSPTESDTQSELSFKDVEHSVQSKHNLHVQLCQHVGDYLEDRLGDDDPDSSDTEYRDLPRRQSFDKRKYMNEGPGTEPVFSDADDNPLIVQGKGKEAVNLREIRPVNALASERLKENGTGNEGFTKRGGLHGSCRKQQPLARCFLSAAQRMRIPDAFRNIPSHIMVPCNLSMLLDTSNHPVERGQDSPLSPSLNQSYDVDAPSGLWLLDGSGSDFGSKGHLFQEKHQTPESGGEGWGGVSKVKRRLLMHVTEETREKSAETSGRAGCVVRPSSSTPTAALWLYEGHGCRKNKQELLKQAHAAQIRALQDEHRRQQEQLLQALAVCYHHQSVSFPCSVSTSRLGDALTFLTLSQPSTPASERCRHLLSAAVKGFLTRRLLRTERVAQQVRTIRDTQQFLLALKLQSPSRVLCSRQDFLLQERVTLQLRAARYEVHDIFFSLSAAERMQLISWDRDLARERERRRQSGHAGLPSGKSSLSVATQKSLERKKGMMIQRKAAERHRDAVKKTGHKTGFSAKQPPETKRGQFRANPLRVPKSTFSTRPR
ncbi:uncharacterized protein si:ch73-100l22.3 isoform X1 [Scophthalmus maximus]|uniref:uncharacterized protein si:ch73-100l22.3 isoform X1 n=1 Tax=Scophthalmus maximus TaxID=52904 RepID=UPI001FA887EB|nr:uncharacterized protein si:ch73-100l22.3 isoform X1 [Scophthalmus maximus]